MNRALIIGILGGVIVLAAVALTFFIDRPPDGAQKAATAPPVESAAPKAAEVTAKAPAPATETETKPEQTVSTPPKPQTKPSFDVVRINPRGDTVLAGRAEPHAEVTIKDGEKVIGKVTADSRGEWVQVPEKALPPGTRELSLSAKSANEKKKPVDSENKVVLVVPERGKDIAGRETPGESGALVIAVPRDGSAGVKVLQTPGVRAEAAPQTETRDKKVAEGGAAPRTETRDTKVAKAGAVPRAETRDTKVAEAEAAPRTETRGAKVAEAQTKTAEPVRRGAAAPDAPRAAQAETATAPVTSRAETADPSVRPKIARAEKTDAPATAGSSAPKAAGEIVVATVAPEKPTRGVSSPTAKSRPPETRELAAAPKDESADQGAGISDSGLTLDAIDYDDTGRLALTGRAKAGANVQVYLDNRPLGAAAADQTGRWQLEPGEKIPPGLYKMRVDQVDPKGRVLARIETPFARSEPLGDLPRDSIVFVQPGNSLWRIARRTYGEGLRYSVIYEANREQIRNPDLIYPGQVFHLPRVN